MLLENAFNKSFIIPTMLPQSKAVANVEASLDGSIEITKSRAIKTSD